MRKKHELGNVAKRVEEYAREYDRNRVPILDMIIYDPCQRRRRLTSGELEAMENVYCRVLPEEVGELGDEAIKELDSLCRIGNRFALCRMAEHWISMQDYCRAGGCLLDALCGGDTDSALRIIADVRFQSAFDDDCTLDYILDAATDVCPGFMDRALEQARHDVCTAESLIRGLPLVNPITNETRMGDEYEAAIEYGLALGSNVAVKARAYKICRQGFDWSGVDVERELDILRKSSDLDHYDSSMELCMLYLTGRFVGRDICEAIYYAAKACVQSWYWTPRGWLEYFAYPEKSERRNNSSYRHDNRQSACIVLEDMVGFAGRLCGGNGKEFENSTFSCKVTRSNSLEFWTLLFKPTGLTVGWTFIGHRRVSEPLVVAEVVAVIRICIESAMDSIRDGSYTTVADVDESIWEMTEEDARLSPMVTRCYLMDNPCPIYRHEFLETGLSLDLATRSQAERIRDEQSRFWKLRCNCRRIVRRISEVFPKSGGRA